MSLYDKFGIIENHIQHESTKKITSKIENYFENLLNSDTRVLIHDYINQVIWFEGLNVDDFTINIDVHIKNYLIQRRNNMRVFIKKDNFEFSSLNKFLKNFIAKLEYINSIMKSSDNKLMSEGIRQLTNLIISDSLIMLFIEEQVILFDKGQKHNIETLFKLTKKLGKYDKNETFIKMLKTIGNVFKKYRINLEEYPLPENIKKIQKLYDNIKFCSNIKLYYKFISEEFCVYSLPVIQLIIENLTDVIQSNTLDEIEYTFDNIWLEFHTIVLENDFPGKTESISNLSKEIVCLINRSLKQNTETNVFKLINILKYVDKLVDKQDCKDIINQKIMESLCSEELMEKIHFTINNLISDNKPEALKLLKFVANVKDKDMFIEKYYQFLIKRLMDKISLLNAQKYIENSDTFKIYINYEKQILDFLKIKFGDKLCYKITKVITDTEASHEDNVNFIKLTNNTFDNKMNVITTSFNNWDVNQDEGIINNNIVESIRNTQLGMHLHAYQHYYQLRYSEKRIINWFPHFGEVSITYLNTNFIMLPIQFMVVEMFNEIDQLPINLIQSAKFFTNYTHKFRNDIIGSLITSGMFKIVHDQMVLSTDNEFETNSEFKINKFKTNLIEVFLNNSDYASVWDQKRTEELSHSREEITTSVVNHLLKQKRGVMCWADIFSTAKNTIKVFELDDTILRRSIEYMIRQDYIRETKSLNYEKISY